MGSAQAVGGGYVGRRPVGVRGVSVPAGILAGFLGWWVRSVAALGPAIEAK